MITTVAQLDAAIRTVAASVPDGRLHVGHFDDRGNPELVFTHHLGPYGVVDWFDREDPASPFWLMSSHQLDMLIGNRMVALDLA